MPLRSSARAVMLRTAAALRRAGAALARAARSRREGPGQAAGAPPQSEGHAFLDEVRGTLRDLSAGETAPAPGPARPGPSGWRRRLGALLEPVRRHEELVLALGLLVGIAVMILHWVR